MLIEIWKWFVDVVMGSFSLLTPYWGISALLAPVFVFLVSGVCYVFREDPDGLKNYDEDVVCSIIGIGGVLFLGSPMILPTLVVIGALACFTVLPLGFGFLVGNIIKKVKAKKLPEATVVD